MEKIETEMPLRRIFNIDELLCNPAGRERRVLHQHKAGGILRADQRPLIIQDSTKKDASVYPKGRSLSSRPSGLEGVLVIRGCNTMQPGAASLATT